MKYPILIIWGILIFIIMNLGMMIIISFHFLWTLKLFPLIEWCRPNDIINMIRNEINRKK